MSHDVRRILSHDVAQERLFSLRLLGDFLKSLLPERLRLGGRTRARTWDPMIKSHLLYQLSYAPGSNRIPSRDGVV